MKILSSFIFLLCSFLVFSQTILHQTETISRTVQDPQVVILSPGFQATSTISNPFIAKIGPSTDNSGGGPTDSQAGSNNPSGTITPQGKKFQDTKGNIDVNGGGQLQFTLPIALPPGVKTVGPQVNLVYTSGSGNGVAGYGWSLSGLTAISRISKNIEKDNAVTGIKSDYSDYYSFNGKRLILKSGEYGKDGATYVTENYSNIKIESFGSISGKTWNGPSYWMITFDDGSQGWYGTIPNGLTANTDLQYNIVKWKDPQGNYITYEYDQNNITNDNITLIKKISWGGNEILNKPNFNSIEFIYKDRLLKEQAYHQGVLHNQSKILDNVIVFANNTQFKKYKIEYLTASTSYEFVNKITEFNSNNEEANPVSFTYTPTIPASEEILYPYSLTNFNTKKYADFDRDGIADFIEFVSVGDIKFKSSVYLNAPYVSLQYDSSKFTADDFKNAIPITFKKNNIVSSKVGIVVPVVKNTSVSFEKNYELQIYSVNLQTNSLDFEYSKTIDNALYNPLNLEDQLEPCNTPSAPVIKEAVSYDFNGDGISELIFKFQVSRICNTSTGYLSNEPQDPNLLELEGDNLEGQNTSSLSHSVNNSNTEYGEENTEEPENITPGQTFVVNSGYILVDLEQTLPVPDSVYKFGTSNSASSLKFADFNGDGIQEIIIHTGSVFTNVFNIKRDLSNIYSQESLSGFSGQDFVGTEYGGMLIGDFNGDSKADLIVPQGNESYNWDLYVSTGVSFNKYYIYDFILYQKDYKTLATDVHNTFYESGCHINHIRTMQYQIADLDADGKSEILVSNILMKDHQWSSHRDKEYTTINVTAYSVNKLAGSSDRAIKYNPETTGTFGTITMSNVDYPSPILTNSNIHFFRTKNWTRMFDEKVIPFSLLSFTREQQQIILTGKPVDCQGTECDLNYVVNYNYPYLTNLARVSEIQQADISTHIDYLEISQAQIPTFYKTTQTINFPNIELERVPQSMVVFKMTDYLPNGIRVQDFRYRGLVSNFHGKGITGFRQFARTSAYNPSNINTIIWSGTEVDPLNDNIPLKEWSIKTNDENQIFPSDISENNNQLLTFKGTTYQKDNLLDGQLVTGSISASDKARVVNSTIPVLAKEKNFLTNVQSSISLSYGEYYLPQTNTTTINNGYSVVTSSYQYYNNIAGTGADYYVGRLKNKQDVVQAYGDTKSSKEEYTYENNLLKTSKIWNRDNSGYLLETYNYDGFGNITQKTISNSVDSQTKTTLAQYDSKGRFVIKKTDNLGLETNITYNDWGLILTQTDPLGNVLTNTYDNWGKIIKSKSNLSGTTTYQYEKDDNSNIIITQYDADGDISKKYTNKLGEVYKSSTKAFGQGQYVSAETQYDILGRKIGESEPYFEGQGASQWNTIAYDDTVYPPKATTTSFNGKQAKTIVSGLTTTIQELNGYSRTTSKTTDALGNVISSTDKGGTIVFTYNAASEQIKAQYAENIVTTKYDVWGRRSEFNDPSNGLYKYEYDGFGQPKKFTSPKGKKEYVYNNLGQLIQQTEISTTDTSTDKNITFSYDSFGRVITTSGTSKGKYSSSSVFYDAQGRLLSSSENSNEKYYIQKGITYDDKGRIISYQKNLYSSGISTKVNIENIYSSWNGELYQVKDKDSGKILWELQNVNSKGQVLLAKLGAATITNLYDTNGFLTSTNHSSQVKPGILQISYSFNAIKNELNSRTTGGDFNITETFDYDDNNRLVNWTNPVTGIKPSLNRNVYDVKGRILENDQVGTIKFENNSKIYQPTGMTLNAAGSQNYNNDLIQTISYNENNDPVFIDGEIGDVAFQYGLSSMRQRVTYGGNFNSDGDGKFTKFYSLDGSFEVLKDNTTGKEKHVLYIGGSPYESNIVYIKNYNENTGSYKFLHKDYIGSILAISDEAGNKVEQRHFDAWGNFTHLQIGNGAIMTDKNIINNTPLLLDRGYTSHEHFSEVGIIHMNGRLYDPLLRRFLNADENIQEPFNTQNYNKYGYVMNNPLMYNDPSGEIFGACALASAVIIGAMIGTASYIINTAITGSKFTLLGYFKAEFFGAVSGLVTYGIGNAFVSAPVTNAIGQGFGASVLQGLAHSLAQGTLSLMQGADISQAGMAATTAFVSSGFMSAFSSIAPQTAKSIGTSMVVGGLIGGASQKFAGGNFWQGAAIGATIAGLNHAMHSVGGPGIEVDKETRKQFRALRRAGDYQGAFDLVNSKYNLDADIKGKYTLTFSDDDGYAGLTGGDAYATQEVTIAKHAFRNPVAVFARVVHHEFVHVYQRAVLGMTGNLSIYQVREFLAYHDTLFNDNLPKASFGSMEGYWNKAREFYNYMTANPTIRSAYQSQYNDFANSSYFSR